MKLFSLLCAAFVTLATLAPTTASAGHDSCGTRTRVTYDHCGRPIYWSYVYVGRDHCGRPVYQWVQASRGGSYSGHGRGGYSGGHGGYDRGHSYSGGHGYSSGRTGFSFHYSR